MTNDSQMKINCLSKRWETLRSVRSSFPSSPIVVSVILKFQFASYMTINICSASRFLSSVGHCAVLALGESMRFVLQIPWVSCMQVAVATAEAALIGNPTFRRKAIRRCIARTGKNNRFILPQSISPCNWEILTHSRFDRKIFWCGGELLNCVVTFAKSG